MIREVRFTYEEAMTVLAGAAQLGDGPVSVGFIYDERGSLEAIVLRQGERPRGWLPGQWPDKAEPAPATPEESSAVAMPLPNLRACNVAEVFAIEGKVDLWARRYSHRNAIHLSREPLSDGVAIGTFPSNIDVVELAACADRRLREHGL